MMTRKDDLARAQAVAIAQAVLLGRLDVIRAAWRLASLRHSIEGMEHDPDFLAMAAASSETDHLPADHARPLWNPDALAVKDDELATAALHWGEEIRASCERIANKLGPSVLGTG